MSVLEEVLRVSKDPARSKGFHVLPEEFEPPLDVDQVDSILLYQLTENLELAPQPFAYLKECFERAQQQKRIARKSQQQDFGLLQEIDRLVIGYGLVLFQVEEFCQGEDNFLRYMSQIIAKTDDYTAFLSQLIQRAIQEDTLLELTENFLVTLKKYIDSLTLFNLNDSQVVSSVLTLFELFVSFKPVAALITKVSGFLAGYDVKPNQFEKVTLLGPILTLSPLNASVALQNYGDNLERTQQQTNMIHESLQTEHKMILDRLFFIMDKIIRGSNESRTDLLIYFAQIINKNHLRRGDHANANKLATNAFVTNIALLLIRFSQPFLDVSYKKIDKIDVNYFNNLNLFLDLSSETRMNSDFKEADEFYDKNKKNEDNKPNFISDCFFLAMAYLHYGIGGAILYEEKVTPQVKRMREEVGRIKRAAQSQDMFARFAAMQLPALEKSLQTMQSIKQALQGFFSHKTLQLEAFDFISGASTFLVRVIDPNHEFPFKQIHLPLIPDQVGVENVDNADFLRENAPVPFKYFPEFVIEGIINYTQHISKFVMSPMFGNPRLHSFIELATVILRCPELVSNPHLKGSLVQVLSVGAMPMRENTPGFMMDVFENNELVSGNLLYALLDFYVIVEKTGSSSQFYDKFNTRYSISILLEELYKIPDYRQKIIWQSRNNADFFVRFVARMLNDLTFLLDEGLSSLTEVHNIQREIESRVRGVAPTREETDKELQTKLASSERQAKSSCGLAEKSITLFNIFSKDIPAAFSTPEIVDRLAGMLDYNLASLVGPKCRELKVKDPRKYSFDAKSLLKSLCTVYINLSDQPEFISAVAKDGRSFSRELFDRSVHILGTKTGLASDEFCVKLQQFARDAQDQKIAEEEEDLEMVEAPDEFLDPLMFTIMKDPVILPTSKVTIDRSTIKAHLLSDSTDPFNRMPLKLEDVVPNDDLRHQIEMFKNKKRMDRG
ncbi:LANO_0E02212g1_1 [Lachancea nothofagi CBS 11611]|uniref:RING-type E3 ubiquitin transferase n=1 Tax=Lachancea nothofagi CBS 11611 TaxID=1266666 RepID=A0A1G4JPY7_9SACH|nr:LANO_0E02212g1_1 [Lachancea nothofagi CBS 11611]